MNSQSFQQFLNFVNRVSRRLLAEMRAMRAPLGSFFTLADQAEIPQDFMADRHDTPPDARALF